MTGDDYWWDQRYEDALFAELGEEEYLRRLAAPARWVTQPGERQHTSGGDCPCQPVQHPSGAWDHQ